MVIMDCLRVSDWLIGWLGKCKCSREYQLPDQLLFHNKTGHLSNTVGRLQL